MTLEFALACLPRILGQMELRRETIESERGVALLATLGVVLALLPVAAAICMQTHLDGLMQRNHLGSTQAFYAAEAGLAHALAEIPPSASLHSLVTGPDGIGGTADDGSFPFRAQPPADLSYDVRVRTGARDMVSLRSIGQGTHGAVRELEMIVAPSATPFTPAALYVEAPHFDLDLGIGFSLSGTPPGADDRGATAIAGLAVTSTAAATAVRSEPQAHRVAGAGDSPSVVATAPLGLDSYVTALHDHLDAVSYSSEPDATPLGTAATPQLTVIDGDWRTSIDVEGFGILVVRGDLEIDGGLLHHGLIVVTGNLRLGGTGNLRVEGAAWIGGNMSAKVELLGDGFIRYDPRALRDTAAALEGSLLHLPQLVGWRELS